MKAKVILPALCAVLTVGAVQAQAQEVKPGLWEMRVTKMEQNGKDMLGQMRQAVASLPAEQRKKMGLGDDPSAPMHLCVSLAMAKDAQNFMSRLPEGNGCSQPKVERSGNRITAEVTCKDTTSKSELVIEGDQVSSKAEIVVGGAKQSMLQESQMKFIGSDCGQLKPLDQQPQEAAAAAPPGQPQK